MRICVLRFAMGLLSAIAAAGCGADSHGAIAAQDAGAADATDGAFAADAPGEAAPPSTDAGDTVLGRVVHLVTGRPLAGRTVYANGRTAVTDGNGQFTLAGVGPRYDAIVLEPDGTVVSMYKGLSRRDPTLPHDALPANPANSASLRGDLSGGGNYPLAATDSVDVYYFSDRAGTHFGIGGKLPSNLGGPAYGPMFVGWDGPGPISGTVMALGAFAAAGDAGPSFGFSEKPLPRAVGQSAFLNLPLAPVAATGRIAGTITLPPGATLFAKQAFYRLPLADAIVAIPGPADSSTAFDEIVPDLSATKGQLCMEADSTPGYSLTQVCGVSLGDAAINVHVQSPPVLAPAPGATVARDTQFSWTPFDGGVYWLQLESSLPTATAPRIYVFTPETTAGWPDLSALAIAFPSRTSYTITVAGLGPYAGMDDALGPNGYAAPSPREVRRGYSVPMYLTTGL